MACVREACTDVGRWLCDHLHRFTMVNSGRRVETRIVNDTRCRVVLRSKHRLVWEEERFQLAHGESALVRWTPHRPYDGLGAFVQAPHTHSTFQNDGGDHRPEEEEEEEEEGRGSSILRSNNNKNNAKIPSFSDHHPLLIGQSAIALNRQITISFSPSTGRYQMLLIARV